MSKKKNLDMYLAEVYKQFISIKDDDFKRAQEVFNNVFEQVKQKMGEQCNYFSKYSSEVHIAGSVYDGIKVSRMDEFDVDIVIRLPISYECGPNGIDIVNDRPGFVRLKIANAFDNLDKQPHWENCHKITRDWRDSDKFLLQNKFRHWLHGTVQKALNELNGKVNVNGTIYMLTYKESGPAYTLNVRNEDGAEQFTLDVDLVPVIRFMHTRWPEGYKVIEGSQDREWLVVPKPNKAIQDGVEKNRSWRLSFHKYERDMMKGCSALKVVIRLLKKLRDGLQLKYIASYYIKTLFLWKIEKVNDKTYWQSKISVIFKDMLENLYDAVKNKNIPYFWHEDNNLIESLKPTLVKVYSDKLKEVVDAIDANDVDKVIGFMLTADELKEFKKTEFYIRMSAIPTQLSKQMSVDSQSSSSQSSISTELRALNDEIDSLRRTTVNDRLDKLEIKVNDLETRLANYEDRLKLLEMEKRKDRINIDEELAKVFDSEPLVGIEQLM